MRELTLNAEIELNGDEVWDLISYHVAEAIEQDTWGAIESNVEDAVTDIAYQQVRAAMEEHNVFSDLLRDELDDFIQSDYNGLCVTGRMFAEAVEKVIANTDIKAVLGERDVPSPDAWRTGIEKQLARLESLIRRFAEDVDDQMGTNAHPQVVYPDSEPF